MANSTEQFTEYKVKYPKTWMRKQCNPHSFRVHAFACVHSIYVASFV